MTEGSNVRLVRCPNCDNLLPELLEYSVYQCGACATILRAKKRLPGSGAVSEASDEEKRFGLSENLGEKRSEPRNLIPSSKETDESENESDWRRKDRAFDEKKAGSSNRGFRRSEKEETSGISGEFRELKFERNASETEHESGKIKDPETDRRTRNERSMRTRPRMDWSSLERPGSYHGNGNGLVSEHQRAPNFSYADVGPSNYNRNPFPVGVEQLERERSELLRKLDELKEQLTRSYPIPQEKPEVQPPLMDRRSFCPPPPLPSYQYHQPHVPIEYHHARHYPHESYFHSPSCSCLTCYDQSLRVPRFQVPHPNPNFFALGPQQGYTSPRSHARWPGELESEKRSKKVGRRCLPLAGGAPFVSCRNCFESLELPGGGKLRLTNSRLQKLRCGACSAVISLRLEDNRKLVVSDYPDDDVKGSPVISNDGSVAERSCSEDFNKNSSFNFRSSVEQETERLSLDESETKKNKVYSSSLSVSSSREELSFSRETVEFPIPPRSPMWQEPGSPRRDDIIGGDEGFDRGNYAGPEAEATELDVSFNEYQHMSQDFPEASREDYSSRAVSGGNSFLVGFIKKSLRDFSRSSHGSVESEKPKVFVNGKALPDRLVKSAEMYAGPIRPGDYWYDYKAGFWGVMGQSCLGIIPPGIEEFNYPMPTNCGAGDTGVYVNGRELNQRDLDLLASRGLPIARDRFYVIEINGKVSDESTGDFVHNLGKLAPTVERAKHGFGMKVPRSVH